jgi:hypothetical protein
MEGGSDLARAPLRQLLLGAGVFVLLVCVLGALLLYMSDAYVARQTERLLIGESVVIGEAWREALAQELGIYPDKLGSFRPPKPPEESLLPFTAVTEFGYSALPPAPAPVRHVTLDQKSSAAVRAGTRITPLLERLQVFTQSAARVLDTQGCTLASSNGDAGECMDHLIEVQLALAGEYGATVRERGGEDPASPLPSILRRKRVRVFTAVPIFIDEKIAAVVWTSQNAVSPLEDW